MRIFRFSFSRRWGPGGLGAVLALGAVRLARADAPAATDAFPVFESYVKVSGYAPWMDGDSAAFASHAGAPTAGAFGIEDLFYTKDLSDTTTVKINGRALDGSDDYQASVNLANTNVGSVEVGYKRFRTFYDGVGGFFPLTDQFQRLSPEGLHVDRSSFWADLKLARPDAPVFTLSFHDEIRTGQKDSTEWAQIINPNATVAAGALVGTAPPSNTPEINPNLLSLAEHHQILEGGMTATAGKTTDTLRVTGDWVSNVDTRYYTRYPNSIVTVDPAENVLDNQEAVKSKTFRVLNQTETQFNDRVAVEVGLTYFHLSGADGGLWITPAYSATALAVYPALTAANVATTPQIDDYVGNVFLKLTPDKNWRADLGFREESSVVSDQGRFISTTLATGATSLASTNVTTANNLTYSHYSEHIATPEVSAQYLGFARISLYGSIDDRVNRGNQHWINPYAATTTTGAGVVTAAPAPLGSVFFQEANQNLEDAKIGANWNASAKLTVRAEVFRKDHQNRFIGGNDIVGTGSYGALYATGYTFTGVTLSVIYRPLPSLSFNTSYQPQSGSMAVTANPVNGGLGTESTSGQARTQMLSETINWSPYRQLYVQGSLNVVYSYLQTAYPAVIVSATAAIPSPIQNADNNYIVGSALCGFVLDARTDAQIQATWQQADNYNGQIAVGGQAYGATYLMESATVGLKHKFGSRLTGDGKVGYLQSTDGTTGGFTNYRGPLAYLSLTYSL
jgi:hypothetical protein